LEIFVSLYQNESNKQIFLLRVLLTIEEYYISEFIANQAAKIILNGLLPFISCDLVSHRIFKEVLIKFKKDPNHNYDSLEEGLKEIFSLRIS
jgi:hypothetical protein